MWQGPCCAFSDDAGETHNEDAAEDSYRGETRAEGKPPARVFSFERDAFVDGDAMQSGHRNRPQRLIERVANPGRQWWPGPGRAAHKASPAAGRGGPI